LDQSWAVVSHVLQLGNRQRGCDPELAHVGGNCGKLAHGLGNGFWLGEDGVIIPNHLDMQAFAIVIESRCACCTLVCLSSSDPALLTSFSSVAFEDCGLSVCNININNDMAQSSIAAMMHGRCHNKKSA